MLIFPFICSLIGLASVGILSWQVIKKPQGNEKMQEISKMIQSGAKAFLKREYSYVAIFVTVIFILICLAPIIKPGVPLGWQTGVCFVLGAFISALAGYIGMSIATRANCRTTNAAQEGGLSSALNVAFSGGAVMGMSVASLGLLGLCIVFKLFNGDAVAISGYAMGASLFALFARSGGGIYTKGADMGADLVGKVEAGIPEDDPRNPAVIADNVGDNVGDVAGLGSDLFESYVESIIAALAITVAIFSIAHINDLQVSRLLKLLPINIAAWGILASAVGVIFVKLFGKKDPQKSLMTGTYVSAVLGIIATLALFYFKGDNFVLEGKIFHKMGPAIAAVLGIISGMVVGFVSEYYTSAKYSKVKKLAEASKTGAAVTVTEGIAVGMESTWIPVIVLVAAVVGAYWVAGVYGVALASLGMLATTGMVVSVDSYGPVADNAGGIAEMAELPKNIRDITDNLDSVGNTTAAIGKGFAIGSAAFAAMALLSAYMAAARIEVADLRDVRVIAGLLLGGMFPFLFSAMLFRAVSSSAFKMIEEVRRQFKEIPGLMEGKAKPDPATCVDISTRGAIRGMLLPGTLAIIIPPIIGFTMGKEALSGVLIGAVVSGLMLGIQFANSGGAMDNAKKYIEEGNFGGKGSEAHKAAIVGDTFGDPLKDTVGPSINILIKLMSVISLVIAPLLI